MRYLCKVIVCILILGITYACTTKEDDNYLNCFEEQSKNHLNQLESSFKNFININFKNSRTNFLAPYVEGVGIDIGTVSFTEKDSLLYKKLKEEDFFSFAYEEIHYDNYWTELPDSLRQEFIKRTKSRVNYILKLDSEYHACMLKLVEVDSFAYHYMEMINIVGAPSPALLADGINNGIKEKIGNEEVLDLIILVGLYYPLLRGRYETKLSS